MVHCESINAVMGVLEITNGESDPEEVMSRKGKKGGKKKINPYTVATIIVGGALIGTILLRNIRTSIVASMFWAMFVLLISHLIQD